MVGYEPRDLEDDLTRGLGDLHSHHPIVKWDREGPGILTLKKVMIHEELPNASGRYDPNARAKRDHIFHLNEY